MKKMITLLLLCFTFLGIPTFATEFTVINNGLIKDCIKVENKTNSDVVVVIETTDKLGRNFFYSACLAKSNEDKTANSSYEDKLLSFTNFKIKANADVKIEYKCSKNDLILTLKELKGEPDDSFVFADFYILCKHNIKRDSFFENKISLAIAEMNNVRFANDSFKPWFDVSFYGKDIILGKIYWGESKYSFRITMQSDSVVFELYNFLAQYSLPADRNVAVFLSSKLFYRLDN